MTTEDRWFACFQTFKELRWWTQSYDEEWNMSISGDQKWLLLRETGDSSNTIFVFDESILLRLVDETQIENLTIKELLTPSEEAKFSRKEDDDEWEDTPEPTTAINWAKDGRSGVLIVSGTFLGVHTTYEHTVGLTLLGLASWLPSHAHSSSGKGQGWLMLVMGYVGCLSDAALWPWDSLDDKLHVCNMKSTWRHDAYQRWLRGGRVVDLRAEGNTCTHCLNIPQE